MLKKFLLPILLLHCVFTFGQIEFEFGELSIFESDFKTYEKDTTANAVFLYEKGENYFEVRNGYIMLITKYHAKKKIINKNGFDHADIEIPYYHSDRSTEEVSKIRAITHNNGVKSSLDQSNIFDEDINEHWSQKKFTFPNVQEGSVLEYSYEIQSPYLYNLKGWYFQDDIPKIYTEYNAKIPANYRYNRSLKGELNLDVNEATVRERCFRLPSRPNQSSHCEVLKYVMEHVPAFKDDEEYMLGATNYRSKLEFELSEKLGFDGINTKYTKTWRDVDRQLRGDKDVGGQLRKKNYFERNIPLDLFTQSEDKLTKAKNIYRFVQSYYTWNEKFGVLWENRVKQAFDERTGNVAEINITLINLLNAADLDADAMLVSTREHGLPKKSHPVMTDFNYLIAKVDIDGTSYLLDATEKNLNFGMLPYRCLNYYGRVMDLDDGSYWFDIEPEKSNVRSVRLQMELDFESGSGSGVFDEISTGYEAYFKRNYLATMTEEEYLDKFDESTINDFYVEDFQVDEEKSNENQLVEHYEFTLENVGNGSTVLVNPFAIRYFKKNPFQSENRYYPVDFGYVRTFQYYASINIPEGYKIKEIPNPMNVGLPDNSGVLRFNCNESQGKVMVQFSLHLKYTQYTSEGYAYVKKFFENAVTAQNNSYVVFEKI
ncbi:DUF3857 domain-containing protein [Flagellimonas zhangzhouensis]|uniref:DUF3857 domain-containing protein n=1 Tax=Flagellimonas zhangzhouensis TaxID=1073328 RepID=A0A1H2X936_9FLAO|nr:DUF3857 domain-containing protein [Allomuricauda zhangzhouensis]SDQ29236.1 protein of unknown function [Allomuricauda zhangzhouensis]SDW88984.1 protein of unknown function [Allomuricauda zhangzhouensis]